MRQKLQQFQAQTARDSITEHKNVIETGRQTTYQHKRSEPNNEPWAPAGGGKVGHLPPGI